MSGAAQAAGSSAGAEGRLRVAIVDDDADLGEVLAALLRHSGHEVDVMSDSVQALARLPSFHPDLVLLDLAIPVLEGWELAQLLRRIPALAGVRIAALTGCDDDDSRRRANEAG